MSGFTVVPFRREYAADFRRLNLDWIERLFAVEEPDRRMLDNPEQSIVAKGGMIFFAVDDDDGAVAGTVAMIRVSDTRCELAKMAVATMHQRRGIGEMLGRACIAWATGKGIQTVFIQTNSRLANSIRLYERLGFRRTADPHPSDYARADVHMELPINGSGG